MNRAELNKAIQGDMENSLSLSQIDDVINSFVNVVANTVADGEKVVMVGFGTFEPKNRAERTGKDPRTGKTINIPAKTVPTFKAGKTFKNMVIESGE